MAQLRLTVPSQATACNRCGEQTSTTGCLVPVRVAALDAAGDPVDCFAGRLEIVSSDPGSNRPRELFYAFGSLDTSFPYYPSVPGEHTLQVRQLDGTEGPGKQLLSVTASFPVNPNPGGSQFWVSAGRGSTEGSGSFAEPFQTISQALSAIPSQLQQPCLLLEPGNYLDQPIVRRPVTLVGNSILGCVLRGSTREALTLGPGAEGSIIRRLTLQGSASPADPLRAGLWVYKASDLTLSNCLIRGHQTGLRLEETENSVVHNMTIVQQASDGLYASLAGVEVSSSLIQQNGDCDLFEGTQSPSQFVELYYLTTTAPSLCRGIAPGPGFSNGIPDLLDPLNWILERNSAQNLALGLVDGGEEDVGPDVDRTETDRGAFGGAWGESHDTAVITLGSPSTPLWMAVLMGSLLLLGLRKRKI